VFTYRGGIMLIKNKRDVERLESELDQIQEHTHRLSEESFNQAIKNLWKQLKIQEGDKTLKTMPMDTISTLEKGMPINLLVNHGFQTIYDIKDERPADLMAINGIGEKGAYSIYDAVSKIKESVYEHANPRINPDHLSENDIQLLESIYEKRKLLSKVDALQESLDQLKKDIGPEIETAKEKKGFIGSLFQSKSKKSKIESAFDRLNKTNVDTIREKRDNILHFTVDRDKVIEHFVQENASYYTEIEKITGYEPFDKSSENLPTDVVEAVKSFPLDTT